jgi:hypothetical protein
MSFWLKTWIVMQVNMKPKYCHNKDKEVHIMKVVDNRFIKPKLQNSSFVTFIENGSVFYGKVTHNSGKDWDIVDLETGDRLTLNCSSPETLQAKLEDKFTDLEVILHHNVTITFG